MSFVRKCQFSGDLAFLSNFYPATITYQDVTYPNVEHAFQLQKFPGLAITEEHLTMSARDVKRLGRTADLSLLPWDDIKVPLMTELVRLKFRCHDALRKALIGTPDEYLTELNNWHDNFWGACMCDACLGLPKTDMMGQILRGIRHEALSDLVITSATGLLHLWHEGQADKTREVLEAALRFRSGEA